MLKLSVCIVPALLLATQNVTAQVGEKPLGRHALVTRHNITSQDALSVLAVGNGEFAFSFDGTGLQTFAGNTMSHWGWHNNPLPPGYKPSDIPYTGTFEKGRLKGGQVWPNEQAELKKWLWENPHRINLGRLRLMHSGTAISVKDITGLSKSLDLWTGAYKSSYNIKGQPVTVETVAHPTIDMVAVRIQSLLILNGELEVNLDFPYPSIKQDSTWVGLWNRPKLHKSVVVKRSKTSIDIRRNVDSTQYMVTLSTAGGAIVAQGPHTWVVKPERGAKTLDILTRYTAGAEDLLKPLATFEETRTASARKYKQFWESGGAIDLSASKDPRWKELERRIVLSQYQTAINSSGSLPPPEIGLMNVDYWGGQFHMEMVWWHLAHYALWDRWNMGDKAIMFYNKARPRAEALAKQLDYKGMMWPKMTGPEGRNSVWFGNNILQWKQPHPIFFAELEYRLRPTRQTLDKWKDLVFGTAEFMADYPVKDIVTGRYSLEPLLTANERSGVAKNGVFELAYWRFGLAKAQEWHGRLGLPPDPKWNEVRKNLAPLPMLKDPNGNVYIELAEWTNNYEPGMTWEHPDPIGVYGMLPLVEGVDTLVARNTVRKVWDTWDWNHRKAWGWDFPWIAMAAARTGQPQIAVDALLHPSKSNSYPESGINAGWYLPGNGGLLYAVAMMAAGWDGAPKRNAPGFPDDGQWFVRWEGLKKAP